MRTLICGVGRSGTTALYKFFVDYLDEAHSSYQANYEPLLWNLTNQEYSEKKAFLFTDAISRLGLAAHITNPLFSEGDPPNEAFNLLLDSLYAPDGLRIVKCIRAMGRLKWFMEKWPDLKLICIFRNPVAVINSASQRFSFFGDEFHPSDTERFYKQLMQSNIISTENIPEKPHVRELDWWKYMNIAMTRAADLYPDRTLMLSQEALEADPRAVYAQLIQFSGMPAGIDLEGHLRFVPATKKNFLSQNVLEDSKPYLEWYFDELLPHDQTGVDVPKIELPVARDEEAPTPVLDPKWQPVYLRHRSKEIASVNAKLKNSNKSLTAQNQQLKLELDQAEARLNQFRRSLFGRGFRLTRRVKKMLGF